MDNKTIKLTICFKGNKLVFRGSGEAIPRVRKGVVELGGDLYSTKYLIGVLLAAKKKGEGVYSIKLPETAEFSESDKVKIRNKYGVRGSRVVIKKNNKKVPTWVSVLNRKITVKRLRNILLDN